MTLFFRALEPEKICNVKILFSLRQSNSLLKLNCFGLTEAATRKCSTKLHD